MHAKRNILILLFIAFVLVSCGTESTSDISFGQNGEPPIITEGLLQATVDTEPWPGEITDVDFSTDGLREIASVTAKRTDLISGADEVMIITILSDEGTILMEDEYSGSNIEIVLDEWGADLPDERWKSSSGNVEIVELSEFAIQVRFNAVMRLKKDLDQGVTDGEVLFIEDGRFNKSLRQNDVPPEERLTY